MSSVTIYTTAWCPYCTRAKQLLDNKEVEYSEVNVSEPDARTNMTKLTGGTTVPQLVINGQATGGCDELYGLERSGELDKLLAN
ncbi:glutaredoxin 3 [Psychromonas marina]|uniref:Glutaredoxin n=1 Tax=Psychromonas marina TaxID=88364 RepID=A0ABQ6E591_9GAMM|nr:glutaredoxin 3 [Psychromonas marina]GLS92485.1 glutaredoxin 3 [Psychromonas marina]